MSYIACAKRKSKEETGLMNKDANGVLCSEKSFCLQVWKQGTYGIKQLRDSWYSVVGTSTDAWWLKPSLHDTLCPLLPVPCIFQSWQTPQNTSQEVCSVLHGSSCIRQFNVAVKQTISRRTIWLFGTILLWMSAKLRTFAKCALQAFHFSYFRKIRPMVP